MKKILFVTTRLIYPVNDGRKVVLYNYCKGLVEQHNCKVRLFSVLDDNEESVEQPEFIDKVYYVKPPSNIEKIRNLAINSLLLNKWPFQVSLYYSKKAKRKLDKVINGYKPDIVISDMARTAEYLKDLDNNNYNKILDMDDILSKRYGRQIENGTLKSNAIGAYSEKIPKFINNILNNGRIIKYILNKEANLLSKYEIYISNYFNSIVFVSSIEANAFNKIINKNKSIDITIGVDYEYFSQKIAEEKKENLLVFLGNMHVAHNKDAVNNFINNVFPLVIKDLPNTRLRIVGRCPKEFEESMKAIRNIEVTGEVSDIRKYVQESAIAIAPLTYGSGIKTKVLETMAMGVVTITNDIGIEGIDINGGLREIIVKNNDREMSETIVSLLRNKVLSSEISKMQKDYVYVNHQWKTILEKFSRII